MNLIYAAIGCFSLAALLGVYLLTFVLREKETPKQIVFIHGPAAATGIVLLLIYAYQNSPAPITSIMLFVGAAIGGVFMLVRDLSRKSFPKWLAIGHGLIALTGLAYLLLFAFHR